MTSKARTESQKEKLYALLAERLEEKCGISPEDLMVSITENGDADWSFGLGEAQFLNALLFYGETKSYSFPFKNCASPRPKLQSASPFSVIDTMRSSEEIPHF